MQMNHDITIQDVFHRFLPQYCETHNFSLQQQLTALCISKCHTLEMGANLSECESCHKKYIHYNSCKNRHCPMCQGMEVDEWIDKQQENVLDVPYFHTVFTVPEELQQIINEYTNGKDPEAYLILGHSSSNKPVSREQAYRVLRSAGHKIGLNSIGAQTMRKTYAWNYYKETGDIYHLQKLFNHASPSITYRFIGEKPNIEVFLKKMTPQENERSRYLLYLNDNGKKKLNKIIDTLTGIRDNFDSPANNDAFYGKVDCLLQELEALMENYQNTK